MRKNVLRRAAAGFGVAACVLLFFMVMMMRRDVAPPQPGTEVAHDAVYQPNESREFGPITVEEITPAKGLSLLAADVERLDADLRTLRRKAERLNSQQQIAATLAEYASP